MDESTLDQINRLSADLQREQDENPCPENVHALNALATARQWREARDSAAKTGEESNGE